MASASKNWRSSGKIATFPAGARKREQFVVRRCRFTDVEAVQARSARTFARHSHDAYGIGLMIRGAHRSWSGRGMVQVRAGELLTCNPCEVHDGAPIGAERSWAILYFGCDAIRELAVDLAEGSGGDAEFEQPSIADPSRARAFHRAWRAFRDDDPIQAEECSLVLLAGLFRTASRTPGFDSSGLVRAKARIDEDPASQISLNMLAREAGLSRWQVIRGFARLTGLTPHAYIVQRRLDEARAMIIGGASIAGAAAAAGFTDQSHFTRAFGQRYGLPPGAWAAAIR